MLRKALYGLGATLVVAALAAVIHLVGVHHEPAADSGVVSRPAGRSELQPPPQPQQLKPSERVVVTTG